MQKRARACHSGVVNTAYQEEYHDTLVDDRWLRTDPGHSCLCQHCRGSRLYAQEVHPARQGADVRVQREREMLLRLCAEKGSMHRRSLLLRLPRRQAWPAPAGLPMTRICISISCLG